LFLQPASYNNVVVNPGAHLTITLAFTQRSLPAHSYNETNFTTTPNGGAAITGALTINSDDVATPSKVVTLAGYWQNESNNNEEPSLQTITNLLAGYQTNINATPIPDLTEPISPTAAQYYGSEVVANSWEAANAAAPVALQELATYRTEGNTSTIYWYSCGSAAVAPVVYASRQSGADAASDLEQRQPCRQQLYPRWRIRSSRGQRIQHRRNQHRRRKCRWWWAPFPVFPLS